MNQRKAGLLALIVFSVVTIIHFLHLQLIVDVPSDALIISRWVLITGLVLFAVYKKSLTTWILVAMAIGVEIGLDFPADKDPGKFDSQDLKFLSTIFLRLVKTIVAPLLFATLVVGIASHSNLKQVGRMGWKSILYFELVTTSALIIGLAAINITGAGKGIDVPQELLKELPRSSEKQMQAKVVAILDSAGVPIPKDLISKLPDTPPKTWQDHIIDIFPENIIKSIYEGNVLPIVFFSVIFGIALALLTDKKKKPMLEFAESLAETMFKFTNIIMYFAPF